MSDFRLELDQAAIDDLAFDDEVVDLVQEIGDEVAVNAQALAPKASGEGAASIHAETERDDESVYADISWDRDHFYLFFAEVGTEHQPATPFLRPALDQTQI